MHASLITFILSNIFFNTLEEKHIILNVNNSLLLNKKKIKPKTQHNDTDINFLSLGINIFLEVTFEIPKLFDELNDYFF